MPQCLLCRGTARACPILLRKIPGYLRPIQANILAATKAIVLTTTAPLFAMEPLFPLSQVQYPLAIASLPTNPASNFLSSVPEEKACLLLQNKQIPCRAPVYYSVTRSFSIGQLLPRPDLSSIEIDKLSERHNTSLQSSTTEALSTITEAATYTTEALDSVTKATVPNIRAPLSAIEARKFAMPATSFLNKALFHITRKPKVACALAERADPSSLETANLRGHRSYLNCYGSSIRCYEGITAGYGRGG